MEVKAIHIVSVVAIALAIVSLAIAGYAVQNTGSQDSDITNYILDNKEWIQDQIGFLKDEDALQWTNDNMVSEGEFQSHNKALNKTLSAVTEDLTKLGQATTTLQNKFIIIEHSGPVQTTPDSTGKCAADFNLQTLKVSGESEDRYSTNQAVYIRGDYKEGEQGSYKIKSGANVIKSATIKTASDGSFLAIFNENLNSDKGQYTAEIELDGMTDCITFWIE